MTTVRLRWQFGLLVAALATAGLCMWLGWADGSRAAEKADAKAGTKAEPKVEPKEAPGFDPAAEEEAARTAKWSRSVVRTYDVRDLLVQASDFRFRSEIMPPTRQADPDPTATSGSLFTGGTTTAFPHNGESLNAIVTILRQTTSPEGYEDPQVFNPEGIGQIYYVNGTLVIRQTEANHKRIEERLAQLRSVRPRALAVAARWVTLPAGELERFVTLSATAEGDAALVVDVAALLAAHPKAVRHTALLTGPSGKPMAILSGRARTWMVNVKSNVGGGVGYDPVVRVVQDGAALEVVPTLSPDGATVAFQVDSSLSEWRELKPARFVGVPAGGEETKDNVTKRAETLISAIPLEFVDRVDLPIQQVRGLVLAPVNRAVVIGGMTTEPRADGDGRVTYLLLEARTAAAAPAAVPAKAEAKAVEVRAPAPKPVEVK